MNNPFGATPGGTGSSAVSYPSYADAWGNWMYEWGPRVQGVGSNAQLFVNRLVLDNRGRPGTDNRGPYNTENPATHGTPGWRQRVLGTIRSVQARLPTWLVVRC